MKKLIGVLLLTLLTGCGVTDTLRDDCGSDIKMLCNALFGYTDRRDIDRQGEQITELERRANLNDQLDAARDILIELNTTNITNLNINLTQLENELNQAIADKEQARIDGDLALAASLSTAIAVQSVVNAIVNFRLNSLNSSISTMQGQITNIQSQLLDLSTDVSSLQSQVSTIVIDLISVTSTVNAIDLATLETNILTQVTNLINSNGSGVQVIKPCPNAAEVLLSIGGKLYAAMNHKTGANLRDVAIEELLDGSYTTTSNSGNCTFTVANGLVE